MGVFEKAGFHPIAYPVSFYTTGRWGDDLRPTLDPLMNLKTFTLAAHEWIGLATYWASGRIDRLFPGPDDATRSAANAGPLVLGLPSDFN
jgi:hypothetical protein